MMSSSRWDSKRPTHTYLVDSPEEEEEEEEEECIPHQNDTGPQCEEGLTIKYVCIF